MDDLAQWLRAQLDDDERIARWTVSQQTENGWWWGSPDRTSGAENHIARHHPARVLREVEAKRRMLDEHMGYYRGGSDENLPVRVLTWLALPYSDRPGYLDEWRP